MAPEEGLSRSQPYPSDEAAFYAHFHRSFLRTDCRVLLAVAAIYAVLASKPLATGDWAATAALLAYAALSLLCAWLASWRPQLWMQRRSLLLGANQVLLFWASCMLAPSKLWPPGCPRPLFFWLREAYITLAPWTALLALASPLPFRAAALVQAVVAALNVAATSRRRMQSIALCEAGQQQYPPAVRLVAAWLAPPTWFDGGAVAAAEWPSPNAAFWLVHTAAHLSVACLVLFILHGWECSRQQAFLCRVRQRRAAPAAPPAAQPRHTAAAPAADRGQVALALVLCSMFWIGSLVWMYPSD